MIQILSSGISNTLRLQPQICQSHPKRVSLGRLPFPIGIAYARRFSRAYCHEHRLSENTNNAEPSARIQPDNERV